MAEKEERISIELLKDDFCVSCDNRGKLKNCCCYEKQEYDEQYQKSLPRQEVIERMAKAITFEMYKAFPNPNKEVNKRYNSYINYAKAALNALLGDEK